MFAEPFVYLIVDITFETLLKRNYFLLYSNIQKLVAELWYHYHTHKKHHHRGKKLRKFQATHGKIFYSSLLSPWERWLFLFANRGFTSHVCLKVFVSHFLTFLFCLSCTIPDEDGITLTNALFRFLKKIGMT